MREQKGNAAALLPIGIFLVIFLGSGIVTGDFYAMPAIVAFLIALLAAFLQHRELGFQEKIAIISKGVGDENIHHHEPDLFKRRGLLRGSNCCRRRGQHRESGIVCPACPHRGGGALCDRLLYIGFHGNFDGNHCGSCADCGRDQREDRICHGDLHRSGSLRRYVWRQSVP